MSQHRFISIRKLGMDTLGLSWTWDVLHFTLLSRVWVLYYPPKDTFRTPNISEHQKPSLRKKPDTSIVPRSFYKTKTTLPSHPEKTQQRNSASQTCPDVLIRIEMPTNFQKASPQEGWVCLVYHQMIVYWEDLLGIGSWFWTSDLIQWNDPCPTNMSPQSHSLKSPLTGVELLRGINLMEYPRGVETPHKI